MKFKANVDIMPLEALLDPQGKAVSASMENIGLSEINNVRIGKHITLEIEAESIEQANDKVNQACKKILCNEIMESYRFDITKI
tara:strand:- start:1302 stop:1553 length:252 start_codon:yes stop_codon:yes gene_type:complete